MTEDNIYDLEYSTKQGLFHWSFRDELNKSGWHKVAKGVPIEILIEFQEHIDKKYKTPTKAKHGNYQLSVIEVQNEFANFKKSNCPKERVINVEVFGYNSFVDNIKY